MRGGYTGCNVRIGTHRRGQEGSDSRVWRLAMPSLLQLRKELLRQLSKGLRAYVDSSGVGIQGFGGLRSQP